VGLFQRLCDVRRRRCRRRPTATCWQRRPGSNVRRSLPTSLMGSRRHMFPIRVRRLPLLIRPTTCRSQRRNNLLAAERRPGTRNGGGSPTAGPTVCPRQGGIRVGQFLQNHPGDIFRVSTIGRRSIRLSRVPFWHTFKCAPDVAAFPDVLAKHEELTCRHEDLIWPRFVASRPKHPVHWQSQSGASQMECGT
jgi:hypothetical protein